MSAVLLPRRNPNWLFAFAGAFDRVSHTGVLNNAKQAGVDGNLLVWRHDYLTNRSME